MKKTNFRLLLAMLSIAGMLVFGLMSFKGTNNHKSVKPSFPLQSACNGKPPGWFDPGAPFSSLSTDFVTHNFGITISGSTAYITPSNLCYVNSATPPWTTNQYVGVLLPAYRPSSTRVFSGTWPGNPSITFQFTLYSTGALYIQQTGGATVGRGTSFESVSYTLCSSC